MNLINLDFETRSPVDLQKCGAYKYAEHPDCKVIVIAVSENGGPVETWDVRQKHSPALDILRRAIVEGYEIHAFNSAFEWCILKYVCPRQFGFPVPDINNMRCTAAVCRTAGLPPSLKRAAEFLKLPSQKDKSGDLLIPRFCVPRADGTYMEWGDDITFTLLGQKVTAEQAFQRFVDYCRQDVVTERAVGEMMKKFKLKGPMLEAFLFDARMNNRGIPMDRVALERANEVYRSHEKFLASRFMELTGFTNRQNKRVLEWLRERGYRGENLTVGTRAIHGNDPGMTAEAKEALSIAAELSFNAVKKIPAMLNWIMSDDKIRGSFMWYGAQKTGRWVSKGPQFQNAKRPPKRIRLLMEEIYQDVRSGYSKEDLYCLYHESPYELVACMARYFVRHERTNVFDSDFSAVEAKILPMLIEADRIMAKFFTDEDIYVSAEKSLNLKDRDEGKTVILATQFQGGWHAVFTATGNKWSRDACERAVAVIRKENPEFPEAWNKFQNAFIEALHNPGKWVKATKYVSFGYDRSAPFPRMLMNLPSKRNIVYPLPKADPITMVKVETFDVKTKEVTETKWERLKGHLEDVGEIKDRLMLGSSMLPDKRYGSHFHTYELSFYGHVDGVLYGRVNTYGGDLLQSATQGTGYDLLVNGCIEAERQGFDPFLVVHDQCLTSAVGDKDGLVSALCSVPDWFKGFPLEATCDVERSYCKH